MNDGENNHASRFERIEHGIRKVSCENAPNNTMHHGPPFRVLCDVVQGFEHNVSKSQRQRLRVLLIPVDRFAKFSSGLRSDKKFAPTQSAPKISFRTSDHGRLVCGLALCSSSRRSSSADSAVETGRSSDSSMIVSQISATSSRRSGTGSKRMSEMSFIVRTFYQCVSPETPNSLLTRFWMDGSSAASGISLDRIGRRRTYATSDSGRNWEVKSLTVRPRGVVRTILEILVSPQRKRGFPLTNSRSASWTRRTPMRRS